MHLWASVYKMCVQLFQIVELLLSFKSLLEYVETHEETFCRRQVENTKVEFHTDINM